MPFHKKIRSHSTGHTPLEILPAGPPGLVTFEEYRCGLLVVVDKIRWAVRRGSVVIGKVSAVVPAFDKCGGARRSQIAVQLVLFDNMQTRAL